RLNFKIEEGALREGFASVAGVISEWRRRHHIDLGRESDIVNQNDDRQQKHKKSTYPQEPSMRRVDQNIFLAQVEISTHFEILQDPVGEFNCAWHVADPAEKSSSKDKY